MKPLQFTISLCLALLISTSLLSQTLNIDPSSEVKVTGTSTLHDWESISNTITGTIVIDQKEGQDAIQDLSLNIPVKSIKSGKGKMDELTYEAFDEPNHPSIKFKLQSIGETTDGETIANGELTMAGTTKKVSVKGKAQVESDRVIISGSHPIDMTEFGITPPTAMLGSIKVGKDVVIEFNIVFITE
jgi:polyisoprenoid-binding protein YceI